MLFLDECVEEVAEQDDHEGHSNPTDEGRHDADDQEGCVAAGSMSVLKNKKKNGKMVSSTVGVGGLASK